MTTAFQIRMFCLQSLLSQNSTLISHCVLWWFLSLRFFNRHNNNIYFIVFNYVITIANCFDLCWSSSRTTCFKNKSVPNAHGRITAVFLIYVCFCLLYFRLRSVPTSFVFFSQNISFSNKYDSLPVNIDVFFITALWFTYNFFMTVAVGWS